MTKSLLLTFVLWALGGPLGVHHFYLRRDSHALLWMLTLGGFGLGWVREVARLPAYVSESNNKPGPPSSGLPPVGPVRMVGQVCVGVYFGTVALLGLKSLSFFYLLVLPLSVGAGVHLVSTVGQQTSDLHKTLIACLVTSPIFYGSSWSPLPISLAATVTAAQHRTSKPIRTPERLGPRLYKLGLVWLAFSAPLGYCVFHNTTLTLYYLSDCVAALLDLFWFLPWLRAAVEYVLLVPYRILCVFTGGGFYEESWRKVLEILLSESSQRERDALQLLSLDPDATMEEIGRSYRELAKIWHPDHNPSKEAEAMFVKIHEAYQILTRRHRPHRFT